MNYWLVTHLYKKGLQSGDTFETLYINFCTWVEVNDKNVGKMKNNQQKITDLSILVRAIGIRNF